MQFFTHIPQPPLSDFVDLFWFYDGYFPGSHKKERLNFYNTLRRR
jgi:hypothetical protein